MGIERGNRVKIPKIRDFSGIITAVWAWSMKIRVLCPGFPKNEDSVGTKLEKCLLLPKGHLHEVFQRVDWAWSKENKEKCPMAEVYRCN